MEDDLVDEALEIAINRTQAAQAGVARELEADRVPPLYRVREVEQRAADLEDLADEVALTRADPSLTTPDADDARPAPPRVSPPLP